MQWTLLVHVIVKKYSCMFRNCDSKLKPPVSVITVDKRTISS